MTNVISLKTFRSRKAQTADPAYVDKIRSMDKLELLAEMVRFQEERSRLGHLTPTMMTNGKVLFKALEDSAETEELRTLTRAYRRYLDYELGKLEQQ